MSRAPQASGTRIESTFVIGQSVEGRPLTCRMFGQDGALALALATIHGNEGAGTPLLRRLAREINADPRLVEHRRVLLLEVANPDGYEHKTRGNAHGVDLNRNFPAANFTAQQRHGTQPLSEPESRAIQELILQYQPSRIITLHQPLECIDYDGGAESQALAERIAPRINLPIKKIGSLEGSLGSYAGVKLGIPLVTIELPKIPPPHDEEQLWARYGEGIRAAVLGD